MFLRHDWEFLIFNLGKLQVRSIVISFYTPIQSFLILGILFQYSKNVNSKSWFAENYRKSDLGTSFQYSKVSIIRPGRSRLLEFEI